MERGAYTGRGWGVGRDLVFCRRVHDVDDRSPALAPGGEKSATAVLCARRRAVRAPVGGVQEATLPVDTDERREEAGTGGVALKRH